MIFNMNSGGGSNAGLNFKVVGGNEAPVSPSENTIWVSNPVLLDTEALSKTGTRVANGAESVSMSYNEDNNSITLEALNGNNADGDISYVYTDYDSDYAKIACKGGKTYTIKWTCLSTTVGKSYVYLYSSLEGIVNQFEAKPSTGATATVQFTPPNGTEYFSLGIRLEGRASGNTTVTLSNISVVEEFTPITEWSFASKNPYTYDVDVDYLDGEATTAGYFSTTGTISTQSSTNKEVYVEKYIPVEYGKTYNYTYTLPESKSMWLAIVEYTGEQVFSKRTVLINSVTGTSQTGEYTPSANVTSVRLSWRTFGLEALVEFVGSEERTDTSAEGAVWISTGTNSSTAFNALKKNNITVYPLSAKQCVSGVWNAMDAKTYQNGAWAEWIPVGALYWHGNECTDITGGWTSKAWKLQSDATTNGQTFEIARNSDHLMFTKTGDIGAVMYAAKSIDLTNVKTIHFKGEMSMASRANWVAFHVWTNMNGDYWATNSVATVNTSTSEAIQEFALDVSALTGNHFLGFGIYSEACSVKVEELYMEVEE